MALRAAEDLVEHYGLATATAGVETKIGIMLDPELFRADPDADEGPMNDEQFVERLRAETSVAYRLVLTLLAAVTEDGRFSDSRAFASAMDVCDAAGWGPMRPPSTCRIRWGWRSTPPRSGPPWDRKAPKAGTEGLGRYTYTGDGRFVAPRPPQAASTRLPGPRPTPPRTSQSNAPPPRAPAQVAGGTNPRGTVPKELARNRGDGIPGR